MKNQTHGGIDFFLQIDCIYLELHSVQKWRHLSTYRFLLESVSWKKYIFWKMLKVNIRQTRVQCSLFTTLDIATPKQKSLIQHLFCLGILFPLFWCLIYLSTWNKNHFTTLWVQASRFLTDYAIGLPEVYIRGGMVRPYGQNQLFSKSSKINEFGIRVYLHVSAIS